ncbi:MAG: hypothetical protein HYV90_04235 [Candidatus Woesebacteria bacterium]|nr:MAG: hypothetical protein HYV90_04235 [Candidatus Woesebacteria bacterium]
MKKEYQIQTTTQFPSTWEAAGAWVIADRTPELITRMDIPALVIAASTVMKTMSETGVNGELLPSLVTWMREHMNAKENISERSTAHPVFSKLFPIPNLPSTVAPEWHPWEIIETAEPKRVVVVQPLILDPVAIPKVMVMTQVKAEAYSPPYVDPFVMAQVDIDDPSPTLSRQETGHLRMLVASFWDNLVNANKLGEVSQKLALLTPHKAAEAFPKVEQEASDHISQLIERIGLYLRSQNHSDINFPLSMVARGAIQLPWIIKAAEAWMNPIRTLAEAGHIELPVA